MCRVGFRQIEALNGPGSTGGDVLENVGWRGKRKGEVEEDMGMGPYLVRVLNKLHPATASSHFQHSLKCF